MLGGLEHLRIEMLDSKYQILVFVTWHSKNLSELAMMMFSLNFCQKGCMAP